MNKAQKIEIEKHLIQANIVSELEYIRKESGITKSQIAEKLGVSKAFISQLYAGNRFFNIEHLAKIQQGLDIRINLTFERRDSIRIKNDPKRFNLTYDAQISTTTLTPSRNPVEAYTFNIGA